MRYSVIIILFLICGRTFSQKWGSVGVGFDSLTSDLCADNKDSILYITTDFDADLTINPPGAIAWDGQNYINMGQYPNSETGESITEYKNNIYFGSVFGGTGLVILSRWDGNQWNTVLDTSNTLFGLALGTIKVYHNLLYIVGYILNLNGGPSYSFFTYNGNNFGYVGDSIYFNGNVYESIVFRDKLYIGGWNLNFDTLHMDNIATWNDTAVNDHSLPGNTIVVTDFTIHKDTLYCSTRSGDVYKLDGNIWKPFLKANDWINALESFDGKLFIGGFFTKFGNTTYNHIAYYYQDSLYDMSGGTNGEVLDLESFKGNIYVAGRFTEAGGLPVNNIARWGVYVNVPELKNVTHPFSVYPNPAANKLNIFWEKPIDVSDIYFEVLDVSGRSVQTIATSQKTASLDISSLDKGLYFLRALNYENQSVYTVSFLKE